MRHERACVEDAHACAIAARMPGKLSTALVLTPRDAIGAACNITIIESRRRWKRSTAAITADSKHDAHAKPRKKEVIKTDPAVQALAQKKRQRTSETGGPPAPPEKKPRVKPHADAVDASKHLWEKLRSEKAEQEKLAQQKSRDRNALQGPPGRGFQG